MKAWYRSRTLWVNVLVFAAAALGLVLEQAGALKIPDGVLPWVALVLSLVNLALRLVTSQPIARRR